MIKQITRKTAVAAILSLSAAYPAYAAVPNTFAADTPASAAEVNANFTDLDGRVTTLEGAGGIPSTVAIDCGVDADALINATITENTTYNITGACNGPIFVREDGVRLTGTDNATDSIVLLTNNGFNAAVNAEGAHDLQITNLFLNITDTVLADEGTGIYARNSFVRLRDSRIQGGSYGINPYRNAIVRLDGTNSITEFAVNGLVANDQSNINTRGPTTVTTTRTDGILAGNRLQGIQAVRGSTVDIRNGITITVPTPANDDQEISAIESLSNASIRIQNSGTVTINGNVTGYLTSSMFIKTGTINGNIELGDASSIIMDNGVSITGEIEVFNSASLDMVGGTITGQIRVTDGGAIFLEGVTQNFTGDNNNPGIDLKTNSSLTAIDSSLGYFFLYSNSSLDLGTDLGTSSIKGGQVHLGAVAIIQDTSFTGDVTVFPPSAIQILGTSDFSNTYNLNLCGAFGSNVVGAINLNNSGTFESDCL